MAFGLLLVFILTNKVAMNMLKKKIPPADKLD